MSFQLPDLTYDFDGLEPIIDARTVEIHYTKHHATYLKNLNAALEKYPSFFDQSIEQILSHLDIIPEDIRTAVKNNGGGYYNHNLYWANMSPTASHREPLGPIAAAIKENFGSFETFKSTFEKAGLGRFGSGYAWLSRKADGSLIIHSTANQETPLAEGLTPLMVVDVWEHAYYLNYQNRRADYLTAWWNIINWHEIERRFDVK